MKKYIIILFFLVTFILGGTVSLGQDGTSGTSSNYGTGTTFHYFNDGTSGTSSNYGTGTTFHNWNE